jgi:hypothetical protein
MPFVCGALTYTNSNDIHINNRIKRDVSKTQTPNVNTMQQIFLFKKKTQPVGGGPPPRYFN